MNLVEFQPGVLALPRRVGQRFLSSGQVLMWNPNEKPIRVDVVSASPGMSARVTSVAECADQRWLEVECRSPKSGTVRPPLKAHILLRVRCGDEETALEFPVLLAGIRHDREKKIIGKRRLQPRWIAGRDRVSGAARELAITCDSSYHEAAARISCRNDLRQIGVAFHHHHDSQGTFPAGLRNVRIAGRPVLLNWQVVLLPYVEQEALWRQALKAYEADWYGNHNPPHTGLATVIPLYACPTDGRLAAPITDEFGYTAAYSSYLGVVGGTKYDGAMGDVRGVRISEITDGTSQTLLVGERPALGRWLVGIWYTPEGVPWTYSYTTYPFLVVFRAADMGGECRGPFQFGPGRLENPCDTNHFWSLHPGGANFVFADGSVHFLSYSAAPIMVALATRAGGEVVTVPD